MTNSDGSMQVYVEFRQIFQIKKCEGVVIREVTFIRITKVDLTFYSGAVS